MSAGEAKQFFPSDDKRVCVPTAYAEEIGVYAQSNLRNNNISTCMWWLCPTEGDNTSIVSFYGGIGNTYNVYSSYTAVRPAIWIDVEGAVYAGTRVRVGEEVSFGKYKWTVIDIDIESNEILLLSTKNLSKGPIKTDWASAIVKSLSKDEENRIIKDKIDPNEKWVRKGFFLLSRDEFIKYQNNIPIVEKSWWLRTIVDKRDGKDVYSFVSGKDNPMGMERDGIYYKIDGQYYNKYGILGKVYPVGAYADNANIYYRPAVWISADS